MVSKGHGVFILISTICHIISKQNEKQIKDCLLQQGAVVQFREILVLNYAGRVGVRGGHHHRHGVPAVPRHDRGAPHQQVASTIYVM